MMTKSQVQFAAAGKGCVGRTHSFPPICGRPPTVIRNEVPYCWQHDPERSASKASGYENDVRRVCEAHGLEVTQGKRPSTFLLKRNGENAGILGFCDRKTTLKWQASPVDEGLVTQDFGSLDAAVRYIAGKMRRLEMSIVVTLAEEEVFTALVAKNFARGISRVVGRSMEVGSRVSCSFRGQYEEYP